MNMTTRLAEAVQTLTNEYVAALSQGETFLTCMEIKQRLDTIKTMYIQQLEEELQTLTKQKVA